MSLVPLRGVVEASPDERLNDLAEAIRREHAAMVEAASRMVLHAVAIGEALIEAKRLVPPGEWMAWIERTIPHGRRKSMCQNYMRLAFHREHVDPELSITSNVLMVRGLPGRPVGTPRYPVELRARAQEMVAAGHPKKSIANDLGVTLETVLSWTSPEGWSRRNEAQRRNRARRRGRDVDAEERARDEHRHLRYGEPGRAAVGRAVRRLAQVQGKDAVCEALLDLAAISLAWVDRLNAPDRSGA